MSDLRNAAQTVFPEGSVWITDIPGAIREKAELHAGDEAPRNCWQPLDYETMGGIKGRLIYAPEICGAGEVSIPLPVSGWYRVYLGLASSAPGSQGMTMRLRVRLDSDPAFYTVYGHGINWWWELTDNLWKSARLENAVLHLARTPEQSSLAWIRLEPMDEDEIAAAEHRLAKQNAHGLVVTIDGYSVSTLDDFRGQMLPFRESNVSKLYFCLAHGDVCYSMPTRCGTLVRYQDADYGRACDRAIVAALDQTLRKHPDVVARLCDFSHQLGLEFHASCRIGAMHLPGSWHFSSDFFRAHPEHWCVNRDGTPATRLSFAAPEVRAHFLKLFGEMLEYEVDGLNLICIRALPAMLYEPAFQEDFAAVYGVNPLELPEDDGRIPAHRAQVMTWFLRQVRALLNECGARRKRRLELSLVVPATRAVNEFHGMALKGWADEGLVDVLMADSTLLDRFHDERASNIEHEYFAEVCAGNACRFYPKMPSLAPDGTAIGDAYRQAVGQGAAGWMMWDGVSHCAQPLGYWEYVQMLGDDDEEVLAAQVRRRAPEARLHLLKTVEGLDWDQWPPHNGF